MLYFLFKALVITVCAILVRSALPRYRIDQLLFLNWKFYIFLAIYFFTGLVLLLIYFN